MAIGGLVAAVAVLIGVSHINRIDQEPATPPVAEPMEVGDPNVPFVQDPRSHPAFDDAYSTVCEKTITGLDAVLTAGVVTDLVAIITSEHQALTQRIASVYGREDVWAATDPLVLEFAETIANDLASILDGTDVGLSYLKGDVALFQSLCQDWFTPI